MKDLSTFYCCRRHTVGTKTLLTMTCIGEVKLSIIVYTTVFWKMNPWVRNI